MMKYVPGRALSRGWSLGFFAALACWTSGAEAQRAGEDAVAAADDAFGTSVGNESLGLYETNNARGFRPNEAGNIRIEGLYFDQTTGLNGRIARGSTVRVGISAQAYAFPAPTGIADFRLRLPGDEQVVSTVVQLGPYYTYGVEVDGQFPIISDTLSIGLGVGYQRNDSDDNVKAPEWSGAVIARLRPGDSVDASVFYSRVEDCKGYPQPQTFTPGAWEPPHIPRRTSFGQEWARGDCSEVNAGGIGRVVLPDNWSVRMGLFRSARTQDRIFNDTFRDIQPNGVGRHLITRQPALAAGSTSGEIRTSKLLREGARRHTIDLAFRGRDVKREFGGSQSIDFGLAPFNVPRALPEPVFNLGATGDDHSRQGTIGLSYDLLWAGVGGLVLGAQKTYYGRTIVQPAPASTVTKSNASPLLYNAAANVLLSKTLAAYASYTRGLEESGNAPPSTANRGEAMPVSRTKQVDAGLRYAITPQLTLVAGVFQVEKPYFNVNAANVFGPLGAVRHRGIEVSLAGQLTEGLRVVSGMVLIQPRISGDAVARGIIGPVATGVRPRTLLLSAQYQPKAWRGFGIDGRVTHWGPQHAHQDNLLKVQGSTTLDLGARYSFRAGGVPASVRLQAQNITDTYQYMLSPTGNFVVRPRRRFTLALAADF